LGAYIVCEGKKENTIRLWSDGVDLDYNDLQHLLVLLAQMRLELKHRGFTCPLVWDKGGNKHGTKV